MKCARCDDRGWNLRAGRIEPCACGTYDPPTWVRNGDRPCLLDHHNEPDRPRRAADGWLCGGHYARFEQNIAELPALYDDLGEVLTASERHDTDQGVAKNGGKTVGLNLNELVVEARRELHNECVRMVLEVADARPDVTPPTVNTVSALATWLTTQTAWMAEQDGADDTYHYLNELVAGARLLIFPTGRRKFTVGTCETPVACDVTSRTVTHRCQGNIQAILTPSKLMELPSVIRCDTCGLEVPATGWYVWGKGRTA